MSESKSKEKERHRNEARIIDGFRAGDMAIQRDFYYHCRKIYIPMASHWIQLSAHDRQDVFQEAFMILWEKMESRQIFTECGETVVATTSGTQRLESLDAYFRKIAVNRAYIYSRRLNREAKLEFDGLTDSDEAYETLVADTDREISKDRIVALALSELPDTCREILTKFYFQNKTLDEILEERSQNTSYSGLKTRKSKCMAALRDKLKDEFRKAGLL